MCTFSFYNIMYSAKCAKHKIILTSMLVMINVVLLNPWKEESGEANTLSSDSIIVYFYLPANEREAYNIRTYVPGKLQSPT